MTRDCIEMAANDVAWGRHLRLPPASNPPTPHPSTMSQSSSVPEHPFLSHLLGLLSVYELECDIDLKASAVIPPIPLPRYEGPRDVQTDAIECSLARIIHRMRVAEAKHDTGPDDDKPDENPLIVPPGLLSATAFESSMGAVEELRLLKAQISDVVRVCNAVAMGDLTHKITASVHGVFMEQLKGVVNTMVDNLGQFAKQVTRLGTVGTDVYVSDSLNRIGHLCECGCQNIWGIDCH